MLNRLGIGLGTDLSPAIAYIAAIVWIVLLVFLFIRARRHFAALPELAHTPANETPPDCMVVIPARNEEGVIAYCVSSFPPDTVIVVDDHSTDKTAQEAEEAGAGVLRAPKLTKGALGKPNACAAGANVLTSRWILFADADTWYEPDFLESAVAAAEASGLDIVSFHLPYATHGFIDGLLVPYAAALFYAGVDPQEDPPAACNGQCLLVRREAYHFFGGHSALLKYLPDDVKLALLAQRHRQKLAIVRTSGLGAARLHGGWIALWRGIERNAYRFAAVSSIHGVVLLLTAIWSALWLPLTLFLLWAGQSAVALPVIAALPAVLWPWYKSWRVFLAPLAVLLMLPLLGNALLSALTNARLEWKGREV